jgi:DNA-directed RNA polymerase subunit K/omega
MDNNKSVYSDYEDDEDLISPEETYHSYNDILVNYDTLKLSNITKNVMTKFEKAKILGIRAQQIAKGAKPLVETDGMTSVEEIAKKELNHKKTPFILKRKVADKYEYWKLEDLVIN